MPFCGFVLICEAVDLPEELVYLYFGFNVVAVAAKPCEVRLDFHKRDYNNTDNQNTVHQAQYL